MRPILTHPADLGRITRPATAAAAAVCRIGRGRTHRARAAVTTSRVWGLVASTSPAVREAGGSENDEWLQITGPGKSGREPGVVLPEVDDGVGGAEVVGNRWV